MKTTKLKIKKINNSTKATAGGSGLCIEYNTYCYYINDQLYCIPAQGADPNPLCS